MCAKARAARSPNPPRTSPRLSSPRNSACQPPLTREQFAAIAASYRRRWHIDLWAVWPDGRRLWGMPPPGDGAAIARLCSHAIAECLRWGETTVVACPPRHLLWAAPILCNRRLDGGLVACAPERRALAAGAATRFDIRRACADLRLLLEEANLTNADLLAARRHEYLREQRRAEAIHALKRLPLDDMRQIYFQEEPALLAAIRRGERAEARAILNRILAAILHHAGGDRPATIKAFFMELVVTMCRAAVESGGDMEKILGANYVSLTELASITDSENLAPWLSQLLERLLDVLGQAPRRGRQAALSAALQFMAEHFTENISRADVAKAAHLSSAYFSRLFRQRLGRGFCEVLNQLRVDRAAEQLAHTDRHLALIGLQCGFRDQSYFTKVFRRYTGMTPRQYRLSNRSAEEASEAFPQKI